MKNLILDDVDLLDLEYRFGGGYKNYYQISTTAFEALLNITGPNISKSNTRMRESIPAHERLACTLGLLLTTTPNNQ